MPAPWSPATASHPAAAARTARARPDTNAGRGEAAGLPQRHRQGEISPRSVRHREADVTPRSGLEIGGYARVLPVSVRHSVSYRLPVSSRPPWPGPPGTTAGGSGCRWRRTGTPPRSAGPAPGGSNAPASPVRPGGVFSSPSSGYGASAGRGHGCEGKARAKASTVWRSAASSSGISRRRHRNSSSLISWPTSTSSAGVSRSQ